MRNLAAFGAGVCIASIAAFVLAVFWNCNDPIEYLVYCSIWFGIGYGLGLVLFHLPEWCLWALATIDASATHLLNTTETIYKIRHVGDKQPSAAAAVVIEQKPVTTRYGELWRLYWIEMFTYADQCGGIGFNKTKDFFGKSRSRALATWRQAIKPWVQQGVVWPIAEGERTELSEGFTLQGIRMWLENNHNLDDRYIPPYPPATPFESAPDQPGEPGETSGKPQEPGQTVYAKDTKR